MSESSKVCRWLLFDIAPEEKEEELGFSGGESRSYWVGRAGAFW